MTLPSVVAAVEDLYRSTVTNPERWGDGAFADWSVAVAEAAPERARAQARALRRCLRVAVKLAAFWSTPSEAAAAAGVADTWQARVDVALGVPAWRPTLELALAELEADPSPELFAHAAGRFRVVTNQPFLAGASYAEWLGGR